jgi:hypothetical protein
MIAAYGGAVLTPLFMWNINKLSDSVYELFCDCTMCRHVVMVLHNITPQPMIVAHQTFSNRASLRQHLYFFEAPIMELYYTIVVKM